MQICMQPIATDVAWSVCVCFIVLNTTVSTTKGLNDRGAV